ncbi:MAG: hypothetical protein K8T10_19125 [Candidatus Eremiobacteraeota bacterium]|nr:hypothetical protein [Candidatus Eremiobacteraeota bacterium]
MDINKIGSSKIQQQTSIAGQAQSSVKKTENKTVGTPKDKVDIGEQAPQDPGMKPKKKWLFMNYVAADCNLTKYQLNNLDQQEKVGSDSDTHIVAYVDVGPHPAPMDHGTKEGEQTPGQWQGCRTLYITKDDEVGKLNSEIIEEHGDKVDMSSPATLKKFVVDAMKRFPADNVALIFNDHGGGFTGAMSDESDGDFMSLPQMRQALTEAQEETGKKLDIIGFDACLMAGTEIAYELKEVGNILLAAEENEGGPGWTYDSMLGGRTLGQAIQRTQNNLHKGINVSPYEFAKVVVEVNEQHNDDIPTFSATDMYRMDFLKNTTEKLAQAIKKTDDKQAIKDAIGVTENYGGGWSPYNDMRDLHHLSRNIVEKTADEAVKKAALNVTKAVEEVVFANEVNPETHPESKGLHIYAPTEGSFGEDYTALQFAKDTHWDEAIESLGVRFDPTKKGPKVWPDGSARKPKQK